MKISKDDFMAYEDVRVSGVTNMFVIRTVSNLSGLDKETVMEIINRYTELRDKYMPEINK